MNTTQLSMSMPVKELKTDNITLYCGDMFNVVRTLRTNSIALVVTDPPYNTTDNDWDRIGTDDEYLEFTRQWLEAVRPKLKPDYHLFLFCAPEYQARVEQLLLANEWPLKSRIVWNYRNLVKGRDVVDKFISTWQMCFHCGTHSLNVRQGCEEECFAVQTFATPQSNFKEGRHHPTAKPVGLIERLVRLGSKPGDTVLDCFAGGGTTGVACQKVGQRKCILVEQSDEFCKVIENRFFISRVSCNEHNTNDAEPRRPR